MALGAMQQGYGEVGKVRGKMDIFWTSLTRPWWKSSKPKVSGGHILVFGSFNLYPGFLTTYT